MKQDSILLLNSCYSFSSLILPSIFISLTLVLLKYYFFRRTLLINIVKHQLSLDNVHEYILNITPLSSSRGWKCVGSHYGFRLWSSAILRSSLLPGEIFSSLSFLTHTSVNNLLSIFLDPKEIMEWNFLFGVPNESNNMCVNANLSLLEGSTTFENKYSYFFGGFYCGEVICPLKINWKIFETSALIVYSPRETFLCGFHCIIFSLNAVSETRGISDVTVIFCRFNYNIVLNNSLSNLQLASSLKDYIYMKQHGAYLCNVNVKSKSIDEPFHSSIDPISPKSSFIHHGRKFPHETVHIYIDIIEKNVLQFISKTSGSENEGWSYVGVNKDIEIWKFEPKVDESSVLTVRGKCTINVAPLICLRFIADERNSPTLDDMFDSAPLVEKINRHTQIRNLRYKTIWPLKARDFCTLLCGLHVAPNLWSIICFSIEHDGCPVKPNYIRGDVHAGYLVSGDTSDSNFCTVTFVLTIDLKGSIPNWAINRLMTSQPMILERAKRILESSVNSNGFIIKPLKLVNENEVPPSSDYSKLDEQTYPCQSLDTASPILISDTQSDQEEIHYESKGNTLELFQNMSTALNISVQNEIKEALFVKIDFNKIVLDYGVSNIGNWQFIGFEKEIVIMRKDFENNIYGFLGMGVIHSPPKKVFEILRNPQNRFVYDNMLKHLNVFHEFNNDMYLIEMQHEHNQCFLKQSRQTCLLISEFSFGNKYAILSKSVEHDLCPINESMKRLNVQKGGWIIEPRDKNGKTYSKIYYLIVIEMLDVPQFVINHVGKRQPLSIAFLRDFIHQTC